MNTRAKAFILLVAACAVALLVSLDYGALRVISTNDYVGLVAIIAIASISEARSFHFGSGHTVRASLSFLPFLATILLFAPAPAVLAITATVLISNTLVQRREPLKAVFNISQAILGSGIGAGVYRSIAGVDRVHVPAFCALVVVFFLTNLTLTSAAVSLLRQQSFFRTYSQVVGPKGTNVLLDVLASPVALFLVMLYQEVSFWGIALVIFPLMLIRYTYVYSRKLQQANRDLLQVLIKAIETRDPYTSGHSLRVASLARRIAIDLGLSERMVDEVDEAAQLHDIGKIDPVYTFVIGKPHDLTPEERALIQTHAARGAELLEGLQTMRPELIRAVRHHHEKYDGSGYPDGIAGDNIPLAARIIMLSDSIDAMLSDRPYRKALPLTVVHSELLRCSGNQFDPAIVRVILDKNTLAVAASDAADARTESQPSRLPSPAIHADYAMSPAPGPVMG